MRKIDLQQTLDCRFFSVENEYGGRILCIYSTLEIIRFHIFGFTRLEPSSTMIFIKNCGMYSEL